MAAFPPLQGRAMKGKLFGKLQLALVEIMGTGPQI
jgi:hypothetical protein